jgi:hypothetical protein
MKRILCIDGGGVKGFVPLQSILALENGLGQPAWEMFDLVIGSSVGAILAALVASGVLSAEGIESLMLESVPKIFRRRPWPLIPKYSRKPFQRVWERVVGTKKRLGHCRTVCITTSVNMVDERTHYFKSDDLRDSGMMLLDAVMRSFAAPMYFGGIVDNERRAVWLDGGTGSANCPLIEALYEVMVRGWSYEDLHILSLGTGYASQGMSWKHATRRAGNDIRQILAFMQPDEGGLARAQSVRTRVELLYRMSEANPSMTFQRLDAVIPSKIDLLDGVKYIEQYREIGREIAQGLDYSPFFRAKNHIGQ